jgi:hypothetical protein
MVVAVDCAWIGLLSPRPATTSDAYNPERNIESPSLAYVASAHCGLLTELSAAALSISSLRVRRNAVNNQNVPET